MSNKKVGAPSKFQVETKVLRISRVVPLKDYELTKEQVNEFINQLQTQALDKCVAENLKKDGK